MSPQPYEPIVRNFPSVDAAERFTEEFLPGQDWQYSIGPENITFVPGDKRSRAERRNAKRRNYTSPLREAVR
jgi:hypothetical protein